MVIRDLPEDVTFEQSPEGRLRNQLGEDLKGGRRAGESADFRQGNSTCKGLEQRMS